jgi:two-component system, NtrC family, nitrogen regulation response regulator NtrX
VRGRVLIVDDDPDISEIVAELLVEEGFEVTNLRDARPDVIQAEIARLEPDVVLLDGSSETDGYGSSWESAAWLHGRTRRVPVIMFTANTTELIEAQVQVSERSKHAAFAGFLPKPFNLQILIETVARVIAHPAAPELAPVRRSPEEHLPVR